MEIESEWKYHFAIQPLFLCSQFKYIRIAKKTKKKNEYFYWEVFWIFKLISWYNYFQQDKTNARET